MMTFKFQTFLGNFKSPGISAHLTSASVQVQHLTGPDHLHTEATFTGLSIQRMEGKYAFMLVKILVCQIQVRKGLCLFVPEQKVTPGYYSPLFYATNTVCACSIVMIQNRVLL